MKKVSIKTSSKNYQICIGEGLSRSFNFDSFVNKREIFLIVDKNVPKKTIEGLKKNLISSSPKRIIEKKLFSSEKNKNLDYVSKIYDFMLNKKLGRDCLILGIGGGITCDIAGFVSSTYLRGVEFILLPTTLLAQVDASIGGKTGVNHKGFKNMIGAFYQPSLVIVDSSTLKSLPKKEVLCGLVEVIKHGIILDYKFFSWIERNVISLKKLKTKSIEYAIKRSIEIKAKVVSKDEKESGLRAILNFGHTFGHAIETAGENKLYTHGEAVALGMLAASNLSESISNLSNLDSKRIENLLLRLSIGTSLKKQIKTKSLIKLMQSDKKRDKGIINFITIEKIGKARIQKVKDSKLLEKVINKTFSYS